MPSSVIRAFDYAAADRRLSIIFQTGRRYVYHDVPEEVYDSFRKALSKGEYFNACIRDQYRFTRCR
jgi:lysyl-tRNA synthetase class 2